MLQKFSLSGYELIFDFSFRSQLIAIAFLLITSITTLYSISQNRKLEGLIGSLYCLSSLICLFSGDFISMIISLEFMTIFSCIIIFIGSFSVKRTRQYFLTHLFSSGLILSGISMLISKSDNTALISLTEAAYDFELPAILILAGCLINVGIIGFNGWIVNCYTKASASGMIYLLSFTTKIALILILKLFSGLEILKFFGISMMIYGLIFALIEKKLKRLICYLTIAQLGFTLAAIGVNSPNIIYLITVFIFLHILYNGAFVLYFAILKDIYNIKSYTELKNLPANLMLLSGFILTVLIYTSSLSISSTYIKDELANIINEHYVVIFFKIATCTLLFGLVLETLPSLRATKRSVAIQKNFTGLLRQNLQFFLAMTLRDLLYLSFCILTFCICIFYPIQISHTLKLIIPAISLLLALITRKLPKVLTKNINLDLYQYIEKFIYFSISRYKETTIDEIDQEEYFDFKIIWNNVLNKIFAWHNQQTSIFIVISLLVGLILTL
ncbi:MAG TPA: cation:proton antiporter [Rickettsia endosymbiont of Pyrocoelia pectoralis]|nr:cation:proton antiporter [Rickettsia endosymbiont of Pyrocoelia pectoralis]